MEKAENKIGRALTRPDDCAQGSLQQRPKAGYIPTLDGWRTLAVVSVILYHDCLRRIGPFSDRLIHKYGDTGVDLFFAISGILICSRLLDEELLHSRISLKGFYARRFCRILPPALFFLGTIGIAGLLGVIRVPAWAWVSSLAFVQNYYYAHVGNPDVSLYTNHFWSLAIEEHFYLLLPAILFFVRRRRVELMACITGAFFLFVLVMHSTPYLLNLVGGNGSAVHTEMRLTSLLFPAFLAVLLRKNSFHAFCIRWISPYRVLIGIPIFFVAFHNTGLIPVLAIPIAFPFVIISTMLHPRNMLSRILEVAPLRYVGRISYSIYLWQQLFFIGSHESSRAKGVLALLQGSVWSYVAVLLIASASFYFIEKPFMRLGHRLAPPGTPGRRDWSEKYA